MMETVYNYNVTEREIEDVGIPPIEILNKVDKGSNNWYLALLFDYRGDKEKSDFYANKLDSLRKLDFYRTINHP